MNPFSNFWHWLSTPDSSATLTSGKLLKIAARLALFVLVATLVQTLLAATPLGPYLKTWWGSLLFIAVLYLPFYRLLTLDTFGSATRNVGKPSADAKAVTSLRLKASERPQKKYAGVRKGPPRNLRR